MKRILLVIAGLLSLTSIASANELTALSCMVMNPMGIASIKLDPKSQEIDVVTNFVFEAKYGLSHVQMENMIEGGSDIRIYELDTKYGLLLTFSQPLVHGEQTLAVSLFEDRTPNSTRRTPRLLIAMGHCTIEIAQAAH